jgi:hypothetical protein
MIKQIAILSIGIMITLSASSQKSGRSYPLVKIGTLEKQNADTVRINAFVLDIYLCPPCPPPAQCKPCIGNHFTATDEKPTDPTKIGYEKRLEIFTERPDSLKAGKRYMITVAIRNRKVNPRDNVTLVSWKRL